MKRLPWFRLFLLLFFTVPLIEAYLFIVVGGIIGPLPTVALVVLTALVGAWLLRLEGWRTWIRLNQSLARGELPTQELVEGALLLVGGALLLTPGFLTDAAGLLCLLPESRRWLARWLLRRLAGRVELVQRTTFEGRFERLDE